MAIDRNGNYMPDSFPEDAKNMYGAVDTPPVHENTGRKDDSGKVRMDLLPPEFLIGTSEVLTFGANKYSDRNWEAGISYGRVFGALMRHMWAWWGGQNKDEETKLSHLKHAACCIAFLITYEERKMTKFDDRPTNRIAESR